MKKYRLQWRTAAVSISPSKAANTPQIMLSMHTLIRLSLLLFPTFLLFCPPHFLPSSFLSSRISFVIRHSFRFPTFPTSCNITLVLPHSTDTPFFVHLHFTCPHIFPRPPSFPGCIFRLPLFHKCSTFPLVVHQSSRFSPPTPPTAFDSWVRLVHVIDFRRTRLNIGG